MSKKEPKINESRGAKNSKLSKERMFKYNEALFWTILHFDKTLSAVIKVPRKIQRKTYQGFTIEMLCDSRGLFYNARRDYLINSSGEESKLRHGENHMPIEKDNKDIDITFSDMKQYLVIKSSGMLFDQLDYFVNNETFMKKLEGGSTVVKERNPFGFKQSKNLPVLRNGRVTKIVSKFEFFEQESDLLHGAFMQHFYGYNNDKFEYFIIAETQEEGEFLRLQMDKRHGNMSARFGFLTKTSFMKNVERCINDWSKNPSSFFKMIDDDDSESLTEDENPMNENNGMNEVVVSKSNQNGNETIVSIGNSGSIGNDVTEQIDIQTKQRKSNEMKKKPNPKQPKQKINKNIQMNQNVLNNVNNFNQDPQNQMKMNQPKQQLSSDGTYDVNEYKIMIEHLIECMNVYKLAVPFPYN